MLGRRGEETWAESVRTVGLWTQIQFQDVPKTKQKC
jgi:hypothetical protein